MLRLSSILFILLFSNLLFGQSYNQEFQKLFKNNDTTKIKSLLIEWKKKNPNDPELYVSAINFYFSNSKQEIISLDTEQSSKQSIEFTDSTGKLAGFINSHVGYNNHKLAQAINYANTGIENFPNRLDIRFGKCFLFQQIGDYENFTKEIISVVEYSQVNKNAWLWTDNKKQNDAENFMLSAIQKYLKILYDTEDDNLLPNMIQIGESTLAHYPSNVEILSTTSVALMLTKNFTKAIEYLKQAEKINPKDFIVLNNIAQGYKLKGDKENAIKYYELTQKYGDKQAQQESRENIRKLKE